MAKHILVADDSVTIQRVVQITFAGEDFALSTAKSADEALASAQGRRPDLVIADSVMPGKSGYDLCQALKADGGLRGVPVLILSSASSPYDEARGRSVGADGYIQKPFDTQAMLDKANDLITKSGHVSAPAGAPAVAPPPPAQVRPPQPPPPQPPPPQPPQPPAPPRPPTSPMAPRTQTMMGMPPVAMPPPRTGAPPRTGPIPVQLPPELRPPAPSPPPRPPAPPPMAVAPVAMPQPVAMPLPVAVPQPVAVAQQAPLPAPPQGMPRPPMLRGTSVAGAPSRAGASSAPAQRAAAPAVVAVASRASAAVAQAAAPAVAQAIAARGADYEAVAALSREVIEKICWEIIPDLAEAIIREHVDRLAKK